MPPLNLYDQQRRNVSRTRLFLLGFILFLAFLGIGADAFLYGAGGSPGIPVCTLGALAFGGFSAWWSLKGGDQAVDEAFDSSGQVLDLFRSEFGRRSIDGRGGTVSITVH